MPKTAYMLFLCAVAANGFTVTPLVRQTKAPPGLSMVHTSAPLIADRTPLADECVIDWSVPSEVSEACSNFLFGEEEETESKAAQEEEEATTGLLQGTMDFGGTFWSQNAVFVKMIAVIGRMLVLLHGLANGHHVVPLELGLQLAFLAYSFQSLQPAATTKLDARKASFLMTAKDRVAFRCLFRQAGFSWEQFREIHHMSMSWVNVEPGQVICNKDDGVFWLYQGAVDIKKSATSAELLHTITPKDHKTKSTMYLIGEKRLAFLMDKEGGADQDTAFKNRSYVAGEHGATLLRMDVPKLQEFLRYNNDMAVNLGRLAFDAMQNKILALNAANGN